MRVEFIEREFKTIKGRQYVYDNKGDLLHIFDTIEDVLSYIELMEKLYKWKLEE